MRILRFVSNVLLIVLFLSTVVRTKEYRYEDCDDLKIYAIGNKGFIGYETTDERLCRWVIKIPNPGVIKLALTSISIGTTDEKLGTCLYHQKLDIIKTFRLPDGSSDESSHALCGHSIKDIPLSTFNYTYSEAYEIEIKMTSKPDGTGSKVGFGMTYSISCDETVTGNQGQIKSANYGEDRFPGLKCNTRFAVKDDELVEIYFSEMDVRSLDSSCLQDHVKIIRGDGTFDRICNKKLPVGKLSIDPKTDVIKFVSDSDGEDNGHGYVANWITVPNPNSSADKSKDMTWIGLLLFGVFTLATIFFVMFWARKNRVNVPRTPDSQCSGNAVFKFDDDTVRGPIRRCNSEGSSVRSSVRGRISKRNQNRWNINDSAVAKKRAATSYNRQFSDGYHTPVLNQSRFLTERSISMEEGRAYSTRNAISPPPNYDSYFGFYSTRRARVMQSPCLPPRSAGLYPSGDSLNSPTFSYDRVNFAPRPKSTAYDTQRMWRSTDSIPDRWTTKSPEVESGTRRPTPAGNVNDGYEMSTTPPNESIDPSNNQHIYDEPLLFTENTSSPKIRRSMTTKEKSTGGTKADFRPRRISRHGSADDILQAIKENVNAEYCEMQIQTSRSVSAKETSSKSNLQNDTVAVDTDMK